MRFAQVPLALWPFGQQPIHMGGISFDPISMCRIAFIGVLTRVTGKDDRQLCPLPRPRHVPRAYKLDPVYRPIRLVWQSIDTHKPGAPMTSFGHIKPARHRKGGICPVRNPRVWVKNRISRFYHPNAFRSMFSATRVRNTPNVRLSGPGSSRCASAAPQGAVINVIATINTKATRFTAPML